LFFDIKDVAIKKVFNLSDYNRDQYFTREVEILSSVQHSYILKFLGTSLHEDELCLITELIKVCFLFWKWMWNEIIIK